MALTVLDEIRIFQFALTHLLTSITKHISAIIQS